MYRQLLHGRYGMKTVYGIIGGYKGCVMDDQWATWLNIGIIEVAKGFLDVHLRAGSDFASSGHVLDVS